MVTRRRLLGALATGVGGLGGCTIGDSSDGTATGTGTPVPTETPGTPTEPTLEDVGLSTTGVACGGRADATVRADGTQFTVVGTIVAPDTCHRARLRGWSVQDGAAELDVRIAEERDPDDACQECLADVGFEITGTFVSGRLSTVVVEIHGELPETVRHELD